MQLTIPVLALQSDVPWWALAIGLLMGIYAIGNGVYGLVKQRAVVSLGNKTILSLLGIKETTGLLGIVISIAQCVIGLLIVLIVGALFASNENSRRAEEQELPPRKNWHQRRRSKHPFH